MPDVATPLYERMINGQRIRAGWRRGVRFCHAIREPHSDPRRLESGPQTTHDFTLSEPETIIGRLLGEVRTIDFDPYPPEPARAEVARLEALGFAELARETSARLKLGPREPLGVIPLGSVGVDPTVNVSQDEVRAILKRFASGDFGSWGVLADVRLDDDMRFAPEAFDVATRNALALERGFGVLFGEYPRYEPADLGLAERWRRRLNGLRIFTLLGPHNRTIVWGDRSPVSIG